MHVLVKRLRIIRDWSLHCDEEYMSMIKIIMFLLFKNAIYKQVKKESGNKLKTIFTLKLLILWMNEWVS